MIGQSVVRALADRSIQSDWVRDGLAGQSAIETGKYELVLLDLGLPRKSGFDVLKAIRDQGNHTPVLIISAKDEIDDRVAGLELGADDYLVKPFGLNELMARIRAVLRRHARAGLPVVGNGEIMLDLASHEATYRHRTAPLSGRELALLHALVEHPGAILSRSQIEGRICAPNEAIESNVVDVLIHSLRKKFDREIIRNVRGIGWMVLKHPS